MAVVGSGVSERGAAPRVVWVSFAPLEKTPQGGYTSPLASVRYRMILPAYALARLGVESRLTQLGAQANRRTVLARFDGADAVVLGKLIGKPEALQGLGAQLLDLVGALRAQGVKVLADFSDDHFGHPVLASVLRTLVGQVDAVVASTPDLAEVVSAAAACTVTTITDPVEGARGEPRRDDKSLRLLWYGHPLNLDTLRAGLAQIEPLVRDTGLSLLVVTAPDAGAEALAAEANARWAGAGGACAFRPWSVQAVFDELRACSAAIIPSNPFDPRKVVKSPNRFTETLWAGRFVVAHPLPAYRQLADYGWVGEDLGEGLRWFLANPEESLARVRRGQELVAERFSQEAVGQAWKAAILKTLSG